MGEMRNANKNLVRGPEEKSYLIDIGRDERIILKRILNIEVLKVWTGWIQVT
jgi:hypothetical protein